MHDCIDIGIEIDLRQRATSLRMVRTFTACFVARHWPTGIVLIPGNVKLKLPKVEAVAGGVSLGAVPLCFWPAVPVITKMVRRSKNVWQLHSFKAKVAIVCYSYLVLVPSSFIRLIFTKHSLVLSQNVQARRTKDLDEAAASPSFSSKWRLSRIAFHILPC